MLTKEFKRFFNHCLFETKNPKSSTKPFYNICLLISVLSETTDSSEEEWQSISDLANACRNILEALSREGEIFGRWNVFERVKVWVGGSQCSLFTEKSRSGDFSVIRWYINIVVSCCVSDRTSGDGSQASPETLLGQTDTRFKDIKDRWGWLHQLFDIRLFSAQNMRQMFLYNSKRTWILTSV